MKKSFVLTEKHANEMINFEDNKIFRLISPETLESITNSLTDTFEEIASKSFNFVDVDLDALAITLLRCLVADEVPEYFEDAIKDNILLQHENTYLYNAEEELREEISKHGFTFMSRFESISTIIQNRAEEKAEDLTTEIFSDEVALIELFDSLQSNPVGYFADLILECIEKESTEV